MSSAEIDLGIDHLTGIEMVGQGGFSVVYAADHTLFKRRMAVKLLNPMTKESDRLRFERECEVMGRLSDHPNVVSVFNAGYSDHDRPFLLMELVDGGTLLGRLERGGRLPWRDAVSYLVPICDALEAAHAESILHRDVKPENILLTASGEPRLADFGIASLRDATGATSTHITASMAHTAPETFQNTRDERSDLYSLASTLYSLVVGHPPFWRETDESIHPLMNRLLNEPAPAIPAELAPPELNALVQRGLAKNPDHRPQSAAELARELRTLIGAGSSASAASAAASATRVAEGGFAPPDTSSGRVASATGQTAAPSRSTSEPAVPPSWAPAPAMPTSEPAYGHEAVGFVASGAVTDSGSMPAGWYHAPGDPPGTQRFWSGHQWQTGPQSADGPGAQQAQPGPQLASSGKRVGARIVDWIVWIFIWFVVIGVLFGNDDAGSDENTYLEIAVSGTLSTALVALYEIFFTAVMGGTLGKLLAGMRVIRRDGSPVSWGAAAKRMLLFVVLSVLSTLVYFPLLIMIVIAVLAIRAIDSDPNRQTIWDKQADTVVVNR